MKRSARRWLIAPEVLLLVIKAYFDPHTWVVIAGRLHHTNGRILVLEFRLQAPRLTGPGEAA
jgi:hypothetical protein